MKTKTLNYLSNKLFFSVDDLAEAAGIKEDRLVKSPTTCHSRVGGNDKKGPKFTFYECIKLGSFLANSGHCEE